MTDKDKLNPEEVESTEKETKPRMSKTAASSSDDASANGGSSAEENSQGREAILQVESYEEAEKLLTDRPDLIEQARVVFGGIVPTSGQNEFMELAINAAAEDHPLDLRGALRTKRRNHLNLTTPEVSQLLEFANEQKTKSPALALTMALLLTDDLTRLEQADLWERQKKLVLALEKLLDVDAMALWDSISDEGVKQEAKPEPKPKPRPKAKAKAKAKPAPPPVKTPAKKGGTARRALLVAGFLALMGTLSCGICAISSMM